MTVTEASIPPVKPAKARPRLEKLEALRGMAAAYVFLAHCQPHPLLKLPLVFAQEAVMLFFILSGFVIHFSTFSSGKPFSTPDYFFRRIRRIYPIFLLSLPWAYLNFCVGAKAWVPIEFKQLIGNLLMLQDWKDFKPGVWFNTFAGNAPLWSLSYEWWFYVMFVPVTLFCRDRISRFAVFTVSVFGAVSYLLLPNQASLFLGYFFLWWTGVEMSREFIAHRQITWRRQAMTLAMLSVLCCIWATPCILAKVSFQQMLVLHYPMLQLRHFVSVLIILICGIAWHRLRFVGFEKTIGWFAILAPISYALYILHVPPIVYAKYFDFIANPMLRTLAYAAVILPICYVTEVMLQGWINRVTDRWWRGTPRASGA